MYHQMIQFEDKLYNVKRRVRESHNPILDAWKKLTRTDKVLRKDGFFWFVEEIEDVEIEEFTTWAEMEQNELISEATGSVEEPQENLPEQEQ